MTAASREGVPADDEATRVPDRRTRLREETLAEIKAHARDSLLSGGPDGVSLRAIAREMGMTAPGLYRYVDSRDELVTLLIADIYDELTTVLTAARDSTHERGGAVIDQLGEVSRAFRRWALNNQSEFALLFGNPPPGWARPALGPVEEASARFGAVIFSLFATIWMQAPYAVRPVAELDPALVTQIRQWLPQDSPLPLPAVVVFLTCWSWLYGAVAIEVFGQLRWALQDASALFESELQRVDHLLAPVDARSAPR